MTHPLSHTYTNKVELCFCRDEGVIEFISPDHTDKNLMIRAVKHEQVSKERARYVQEYLELKCFWSITPYIETLLGDAFTGLLSEGQRAQG